MVDRRPLIAHVVYRFDVGGLENGVANLINHMPVDAYRHAVISLTEITDFKRRIQRSDVQFIALEKPPGHLISDYPRIFRIFRDLQPAVVHTRNLAALEATVPAWAAGVRVRVHGEHGREGADLDPANGKYRLIRKLYQPFVTRYIALSRDLEGYLVGRVGVPERKVSQIYNGVDTARFRPRDGVYPIVSSPFCQPNHWLIGTVGRMQRVKDQTLLVRAFRRALELAPDLEGRLRLVMVGDGPLRTELRGLLDDLRLAQYAWLPGERSDVPDILRGLDCFVLPSLSEGISNTILEAMASGLPVIATAVGGNVELVEDGRTGTLVPAADPETMARAMIRYARDPGTARLHGAAARLEVERRFSMRTMINAYMRMYEMSSIRL